MSDVDSVAANLINVSPTSRYVGTPVYNTIKETTDPDTDEVVRRTVPFFGTWSPPEIVERRASIDHVVAADEAYRPELISYRVYADKSLFWAIALRNGIIDVFEALTVGRRLVCPHIDDIVAALSAAAEVRPSDL